MTEERLTSLPLLASIALTATVLAAVIAWQATGVPLVALLLVPWLLVMIALILPFLSSTTHDVPAGLSVQRRSLAVGMATVAVAVALTTTGDWTDAGDADQEAPAVLASSVLTVADESTVAAEAVCDESVLAWNGPWGR